MWYHFFKITWQNLRRSRVFTLLNIGGLAIGIAAALLILLWVEHEHGYNKQFTNLTDIYQMKTNTAYQGKVSVEDATPGLLAGELKKAIPEIQYAAPVLYQGEILTSTPAKQLYFNSRATTQDFFSIFNFKPVYGNLAMAFMTPNSIVITQKVAKAFFGTLNPVGSPLKLYNNENFTVQAVIENLPDNMAFDFDMLCSLDFTAEKYSWLNTWNNIGPVTYVSVANNANAAKINAVLNEKLKENPGESYFTLYPLKDIHLFDAFDNNGKISGKGKITMVRLFTLIAFAILLIACINFMNLTTARAENRAKEVGIKKILGAKRRGLIAQFVSEALLFSFLSVLVALIVVRLTLPAFSKLVAAPLTMRLGQPTHWLFLIGITLICGCTAGSYPAVFLSGFKPLQSLKKQAAASAQKAGLLRKGLVVFQFSISILLIISTIVIYCQIQFTKSRDLGFNQQQIIEVPHGEQIEPHYAQVKQQLLQTGKFDKVSMAVSSPYNTNSATSGLNWSGKSPDLKPSVSINYISAGFLSMLAIPILKGTGFKEGKTDTTQVIINQALARIMEAEGKPGSIIRWGSDSTANAYEVMGICKDFVHDDIHAVRIGPMIFFNDENRQSNKALFLRLKKGVDMEEAIAIMRNIFREASPDYPFEYHFLDEQFDKLFQSQRQTASLALLFGTLAILISCLGLFGLTAYMAEQRTKEIGIRKILGASVFKIIKMLSGDFLKLIVIAGVISIPIARLSMNKWLSDYPYRMTIHWWIYGIAIVLTLLIALATVYGQALKAAKANPVNSLRSE